MRSLSLLIGVLVATIGLMGCARAPLPDSRRLLPEYRDECLHRWEAITDEQERHAARERWDAVVRFAPVIRQELHKDSTHQQERSDFILSFTYDGNSRTADNEDNLDLKGESGYRYPLHATVYYALVETRSHRFITYFLYHAVDWAPYPNFFWLGITHENDGESLQVVTRKQAGGEPERVILLATQAHHVTRFYVARGSNVGSGDWALRPDPIQLAATRQGSERAHPVVGVDSGGHGIHGTTPALQGPDGLADHIAFLPADRTEEGDGWVPGGRAYEYQLVPLHDTLWRYYIQGQHVGNGGILDGGFDYCGDLATYPDVPRFFDSDRLSFFGTWKKDSGIVPFVLDSGLLGSRKGRLFFDPAHTYQEHLTVPDDWSTEYTYNPYLPPAASEPPQVHKEGAADGRAQGGV